MFSFLLRRLGFSIKSKEHEHRYEVTRMWIDEVAGFVRATERCLDCGDSYDWQPFYIEQGHAFHYTRIVDGQLVR